MSDSLWSAIVPSLAEGAVTGALALVGIAWGVKLSSDANRYERHETRTEEKAGLRAALTAELRFLRDSYAFRENKIFEAGLSKERFFDVPRRDETQVFDSLIERIVLLTEEQARVVVHAYISAHHLLPNLVRLEARADERGIEPPPGRTPDGYVRVRRCNFNAARKEHTTRIDLFGDAIKVLDRP